VVTFTGLTTNTFLNTTTCTVSATGLSSSSFQCPYTHANVSSVADTGYAYNATIYQGDQTHLTNTGYATVMGGAASNAVNYGLGYSSANPHRVSTTPYAMGAVDANVEATITGNSIWTLPSCTGQSGAVYTIFNSTAFTLTLKTASASQTMNGVDYSSTGLVIPSYFQITDVPNTGAAAGCHWDSSLVAGTGAVSTVANSDGTLTISPTSGSVIASLNLAHANTWTAAITGPGFIANGTTPGIANWGAGTGSIPALLANSAGFAGPVTGGTSYLFKPPATITAGILHAAAPATGDGVNESVLTSSAVVLTSEVSGLLPVANGGTGTSTPGIVAGSNITVTGTWPNQTVAAAAAGTGISGATATQLLVAGSATTATSSVAAPSGTIVGTTDTQTLTNKSIASSQVTALPLSCQPGIGDGFNAIPVQTYLTTTCKNETGRTWTLTAIRCFSDNSGTSTCNVTNGTGTALLTGAITATSSYANGTQSGTTTIASGDSLKITYVSDGTSKQIGIDVVGTF
jgi:hypothetical protein